VAKKGKRSKQRKGRTKPGTERKSEERKSEKERADEAVDEAEEESFPASDAPAYPDSNEATAPTIAANVAKLPELVRKE
jgi:hypothetical protein